ncbi:MAG: sulfite exporter TauE/SafE family protein [Clostridiales bacterium]|nr:sulfite exporter TauE/SafE family protein [Clostridiales bacterium]
MRDGIETKKLSVGGMTCASCQSRIEKRLSGTAGVKSADVSYSAGTAVVCFDPAVVSQGDIAAAIRQLGYEVLGDGRRGGAPAPAGGRRAAGILIIAVAAYLILQRLGPVSLFNLFPTAEAGMGYGMLFAVGLLTSVHCVAMCGGINLSQCMPRGGAASAAVKSADGVGGNGKAGGCGTVGGAGSGNAGGSGGNAGGRSGANSGDSIGDGGDSSADDSGNSIGDGGAPKKSLLAPTLRPAFLYNLGRVASYAAVGGIVGALGAAVSFTGAMKGAVQLLAGAFMVVMGVNMLGAFAGSGGGALGGALSLFRKLAPRLPKKLARSLESKRAGSNSPLYVGLLNGLMPCGPLQAMQLYALSAGSAPAGALSMLAFSLGTTPLMFGLGALSSALGKKFSGRMMAAGGALVVLFGLSMFSGGWALSGLPGLSSVLPPASSAPGRREAVRAEAPAAVVVEGGAQLVRSTLGSGQYPAITVAAGTPVRWVIDAPKGSINGCNNRMIIPEYGIEHSFQTGENVIEFEPEKPGKFAYSCWMGMIRSTITVVGAD